MNILHVVKKYPGAVGGDAVVVANLQNQQQAAGHHVAVLTSNCDEIANGPHVYKFGLKDTPAALDTINVRRLISLAALFLQSFYVLARERPQVIHTHSIDMAFAISFAARLFRVPLVHTFHIVTFYDESQSLLRRKTELWLARAAGVQVVTAPNTYDVTALRCAIPWRATLLPNGVDLDFWQPPKKRPHNDTFTFISVGRLETQKGYEYLIRAAALIADAPQPFRIVIVGDGSLGKPLRRLAGSLGADSHIAFAGRQSAAQTRALMARADAAIFASLYETTPLTLLEAWAVGLPVITTKVGILRGTARQNHLAYVVTPQDVQSLAAAMELCMSSDISRAAMAVHGRREAAKYAWPDIAHTAEKIYGSVL